MAHRQRSATACARETEFDTSGVRSGRDIRIHIFAARRLLVEQMRAAQVLRLGIVVLCVCVCYIGR